MKDAKKLYLIFFDSPVPNAHEDFTVRLYLKGSFEYNGVKEAEHFTQHIEESLDISRLSGAIELAQLVKRLYPELDIKLFEITTFSEQRELDLDHFCMAEIAQEMFCASLSNTQ